ncbi:MAG TPA: hypothetical protein VGD71_30750 [Kribbella sp.]
MDPVTIAAAVGALFAPYFKKAAEAFAGEAGKYVHGKVKGMWEKLRARVAGDPQAAAALDRFERDPDGARPEFEALVEKQAAADTALRDELAEALAEIKRQAPNVKVVQRMKEAEELVGVKARRMARGNVDVTQEVDKATKATGAEFDEIG